VFNQILTKKVRSLLIALLNKRLIYPHPFVPSPKNGGGEESEKQGIASASSLGSPCFSDNLIRTNVETKN
jgi:hypothetical protein